MQKDEPTVEREGVGRSPPVTRSNRGVRKKSVRCSISKSFLRFSLVTVF